MTTTERITAVRRELVHRQGGKCARCGKPMGDDVHIVRIRTLSAGAGPALVSAGNMVATHPACTIEPDLVHAFYVPGCECTTCVKLKTQGDRDAHQTPLDVRCGRCDAKPGEGCFKPRPGLPPERGRFPQRTTGPAVPGRLVRSAAPRAVGAASATRVGLRGRTRPGRRPPVELNDRIVKGGEKTCHWGGVKLYHLGGA